MQLIADFPLDTQGISFILILPTSGSVFSPRMLSVDRGRFSMVVKGIDKSTDQVVVAKLSEYRPDTESAVDAEFEAMRSLRHERLASLFEAYK